MDVKGAADTLGVSPRRVTAMISSGRVKARKVGGRWVIEELPTASRSGRPLSQRSRALLTRALHTRSLAGLKGQDLARTAARLRELRSSKDPAKLLADWWDGKAPRHDIRANLVQHAIEGHHSYVADVLQRPRVEYLRRSEDLADVIHTERRIRGMDVRALATAAGVAEEDVTRMEKAEPLRSPAVARRVLRSLNVEPTALPNLVEA